MQAVEGTPCLQFPSLPVPVINTYLGTMEYCCPIIPLPMHDPDPLPIPGVIYPVWKSNLVPAFSQIWKLISQGGRWFASIDTEFPGTIYDYDKGRLHDPLYKYMMMKKNVNDTNIIQLGLTLADLNQNIYTWEFNFSDFDIDREDHKHIKRSIELLKRHGIDFWRNKEDGIPSHEFARMCREVGLLENRLVELTWVGFQISSDLGYFTKILTGQKLPDDFEEYKKAERIYFGDRVCDVKDMMNSFPTLKGGLTKVAEKLGIARVAGKSHQAGSDSLLTYLSFIKLSSM
ncbi:putative poly(A)-specific ribonuclease [Rosa chinensis]|uniref:poly(A)-specific ribonuclease n=2 Tax=Rosa chinensis TaxID=74649 RepID=A0A2P6RV83_ROSCH|nr:putative poly(A)-specific ribonuclease [Rosa chinensis]